MLSAGHRIGNYEVVRTLGSGGQGVVYLARHVMLDRLDAVKVLLTHLAGDPGAQQRFQQEAVGAARLHHPNIAGVHDAGRAADGSFYVAMQYVDGPSLDRLIPAQGLAAARTVRLVAGLADALDAAHAHGLLHRDVKPGNVIVARAGTATEHAYLVDFGIAKLVDGTREALTVGPVMGTYAYIAPERIDGRSGDSRSDQYSLACTAYHCLTGTVPFPGDGSGAAIRAHLLSAPPPVTARRPDLPREVDTVLSRALAKDPAARYPTCVAFATALRDALARTVAAPTSPAPQPAPSPAPTKVVPEPVAPRYVGRAPSGWVPPRAAALRPWDTGRPPLTWLGLVVAGGVALVSSVPVRRILTGHTDVPLDLQVQFCALMLVALVAGGLGTWLLARRSAGAWFMLLLSLLAAPLLRVALSLTRVSGPGDLTVALQWVAFQPLEAGYSAFTVHNGSLLLSQHGVFLTGLCLLTALVYGYGWWKWSTGAVHVGRTPRREWPWLGGAVAVAFVAALTVGDLPDDVGVLIALALALNLVAAYALARKYVEGWLLFLAAQLAHVSYALTVADNRPRPPSMAGQGLLGAGTAIAPSMALYYVAAGLIGLIGLATWLVDLRRGAGLPLLVRRYGSGVPPR